MEKSGWMGLIFLYTEKHTVDLKKREQEKVKVIGIFWMTTNNSVLNN